MQEDFDIFKEQSKKKSEENLNYEKEKQEITEKTIQKNLSDLKEVEK